MQKNAAMAMGHPLDESFAPVCLDDGHEYFPVTVTLEHADALELQRARAALKTGQPLQSLDKAVVQANKN
jgi:hypothetical protein